MEKIHQPTLDLFFFYQVAVVEVHDYVLLAIVFLDSSD